MSNSKKNRANVTDAIFKKSIDLLYKNKSAVSLENIQLLDKQHEIDGKRDEWILDENNGIKNVTISNVKIGRLQFRNWHRVSIHIYNSEINSLWFDENCQIEEFEVTDCPEFGSILFREANIKKVIINRSLLTGFRAYNTENDKILFQSSSVKKQDNVSDIYEGFSLDSSTINEVILNEISKQHSICDMVFSQVTIKNLIINKSNNIGCCNLTDNSDLERFTVSNSLMIGGICVNDLSNIQFINISDCKYIEKISLESVTKLQILRIIASEKNLIKEKSNILNNLIINNQTIPEGLIKNIQINDISFNNNFRKDSILQVTNVDFKEISFLDFNNLGSLKFSNLNAISDSNAKIRIQNSDLGKAQFIGCDLEEAQLEFNDSKLLEIFVVGTDLPNYLIGDNKNRLEQQRLALGQLQKVYENNGDNVRAIAYQARNLETHREQLLEQSPKWFQFCLKIITRITKYILLPFRLFTNQAGNLLFGNKRLSRKDRSDLISLTLNNISNNYGNSLYRAFWVTIIISASLFMFYCLSADFMPFWMPIKNSNKFTFIDMLGYYLEFLSPIHRSDFMITNNLNGSTRVIDAISRLVNSYTLYQFIQAFRKYGKKG